VAYWLRLGLRSHRLRSLAIEIKPKNSVGSSKVGASKGEMEAKEVEQFLFSKRRYYESLKEKKILEYVSQESLKACPGYKDLIDTLRLRDLEIVYIPADGNCQFASVAHQIGIQELDHSHFRKLAVNWLDGNKQRYEGFLVLDGPFKYNNWNDYITKMKNDGNWGDSLTLLALANVIGRPITIFSSNTRFGNCEFRPDDTRTQSPIVLGHFDEMHYCSTQGSSKDEVSTVGTKTNTRIIFIHAKSLVKKPYVLRVGDKVEDLKREAKERFEEASQALDMTWSNSTINDKDIAELQGNDEIIVKFDNPKAEGSYSMDLK